MKDATSTLMRMYNSFPRVDLENANLPAFAALIKMDFKSVSLSCNVFPSFVGSPRLMNRATAFLTSNTALWNFPKMFILKSLSLGHKWRRQKTLGSFGVVKGGGNFFH